MRALKGTLLSADNLKSKYKDEDEFSLILRAIIESNMPKFLSQDINIFKNIISDIFPNVKHFYKD